MKKINENTTTNGSPGTKGYTGYVPTEKYASYKSRLAKIIKKSTGYDMIDLEPVVMDTIDVKDNEINQDDVDDKNIASKSRHKELTKDFEKQMNESMPTLKELLFAK